MGAGKSSIGKNLAEKTSARFIDVDEYIQHKYNSTISQIFENEGEDFFRQIEANTFSEIINNNEMFYEKLFNQSLFENEKVITINRCSEKIFDIIKNIIEKKISDIKIILNANILEKKSKLRNLF